MWELERATEETRDKPTTGLEIVEWRASTLTNTLICNCINYMLISMSAASSLDRCVHWCTRARKIYLLFKIIIFPPMVFIQHALLKDFCSADVFVTPVAHSLCCSSRVSVQMWACKPSWTPSEQSWWSSRDHGWEASQKPSVSRGCRKEEPWKCMEIDPLLISEIKCIKVNNHHNFIKLQY